MEFIPLLILAGFLAGGIYKMVQEVRESNRNSKIFLCHEGDWMKLSQSKIDDVDNNKPEYIRMNEDITEADMNSSWQLFGYEFFEPDGHINSEIIGGAIRDYAKVNQGMQKRLEIAYAEKRVEYVKEKKKMQSKALEKFLA
jgi:hypothetical protein